jgi:hypothetical protein
MHMPSESVIKRTIRNNRVREFPRQPTSLQDLVIGEAWALTGGENPTRFLAFDNGPKSQTRIIVFVTDEHLRYLANSRIWMMDGNLGKAVFYQYGPQGPHPSQAGQSHTMFLGKAVFYQYGPLGPDQESNPRPPSVNPVDFNIDGRLNAKIVEMLF